MEHYEKLWRERTAPGRALARGQHSDIYCNTLVGHLAEDFWGQERMGYCTHLSAEVATCVAETLEKFSVEFDVEPPPDPGTASGAS
jgi:hypothetical protein